MFLLELMIPPIIINYPFVYTYFQTLIQETLSLNSIHECPDSSVPSGEQIDTEVFQYVIKWVTKKNKQIHLLFSKKKKKTVNQIILALFQITVYILLLHTIFGSISLFYLIFFFSLCFGRLAELV